MKCIRRLFDLDLTRFELFMIFGIYATMTVMRGATLMFPTYGNITPDWKCGAQDTFSRNCSLLEDCAGNLTFQSPFYSARQEFGLMCDSAYMAAMVSSVMFVGVLIGANVFGQLSDAFGRRRILMVTLSGEALLGFASSFSWNFASLTALRFLTGFFAGGNLVVATVYLVECIKPQQRIFMFTFVSWPVNQVIIASIAYITNSWRTFLMTSSCTGLLCPILVLFVAPESPKWAADRGNPKLVAKIRERIDWINGEGGKTKDKELKLALKAEASGLTSGMEKPKINFALKDLFATRELTKLTAVLCVMWPTIALTSYTIGFDSRNLDGNFYLNQLLMASFNFSANAVLFTVDTYVPKFNRRKLHQGPQLIAAIMTGTIAILLAIGLEGRARLAVTGLAVSCTFFASFVWDAVYLCTAELFPTEVRATAFGICNLFARSAVILAPQAVLLREVFEAGPYLIMSIMGFIAFGISVKFLPDTKGRELPSSVKDVEALIH